MIDLIMIHLTRKKVDAKSVELGKIEQASGNTLRQTLLTKQGIDKENAQKIIKAIKNSKIKVQVSIQGDSLRVNSKKRDDLQKIIELVKNLSIELPINYINFRD